MSKNLYINGPINVVRLEGTVNNINKTIYLFMDVHVDPTYQTECENIRSIDVRDYFVQTFDKLTNTDRYYDFFVEDFPMKLHTTHSFKEIYITQIRQLLHKSMNLSDGIVKRSTEFPNVRFHYLDIRDYTKLFHDTMKHLQNFVFSLRRGERLVKSDFNTIMDAVHVLAGHSKFLYDIFFKNDTSNREKIKSVIPGTANEMAKRTKDDNSKITRQIIQKMLHKYQHKDVQKEIIKYMNTYLKKYFHEFFKYSAEFKKYLDNHYKYVSKHPDELVYDKTNIEDPFQYGYTSLTFENIINGIYNIFVNFKNSWWEYQACIMDIYFIRRFLDKDYVTNAIVYTGAAHSHNYIYFLIKYFDFKITNYSFMKGKLSDNIKKIHNMNNPFEIKDMFYPKMLYQCSNLTDFPVLFK